MVKECWVTFTFAIDGLKNENHSFSDTNFLFIQKKSWPGLEEKLLTANDMGQEKRILVMTGHFMTYLRFQK